MLSPIDRRANHPIQGIVSKLATQIWNANKQDAMKRIVISSFVLLLSACSATGPIYSPAPPPKSDQALLYFYRPDTSTLGARTLAVTLDSEPWAELQNNAYVTKYVAPGKHTISTQWTKWLLDQSNLQKPLQIAMTLRAGGTYYVRLSSSQTGNTIQWQLSSVPEAEASGEITKTKAQ